MKNLLVFMLLALGLVACTSKPTDPTKPVYRCEQMTPENKVSGCKLGDWWNFDLQRCNSTEERCQK